MMGPKADRAIEKALDDLRSDDSERAGDRQILRILADSAWSKGHAEGYRKGRRHSRQDDQAEKWPECHPDCKKGS